MARKSTLPVLGRAGSVYNAQSLQRLIGPLFLTVVAQMCSYGEELWCRSGTLPTAAFIYSGTRFSILEDQGRVWDGNG